MVDGPKKKKKNFAKLPVVVAEVERIAGREAALALSRARGGRTVYIPAEAKPDHWLAEAVGLEAAQKICNHYSSDKTGGRLLIPIAKLAQQQRQLVDALNAGKSASTAAQSAGMHERSAFRALKRLKRQGELF